MSRNPCPLCHSRKDDEEGRCIADSYCVPRFNRLLGQKAQRMRRRNKSNEEVQAAIDAMKAEFNARIAEFGEFRPVLDRNYYPEVQQ